MLATPSTSHLDFSAIYEPSEDSYLLLDTLCAPSEVEFLQPRLLSLTPLVCEVGTGSGIVLAFAAANTQAIFGRTDVLTLGIDLSWGACRGTEATLRRNASSAPFLGSIQADLSSCVRPGTIDVLIFNPPYVPSESVPVPPTDGRESTASSHDRFERDANLLALTTDGGTDGMEVTNTLLAQIPIVLSSRGVAYVLLCAQNKPDVVKQGIRTWGDGWSAETVRTSGRQGGWERLQIVRIWRMHQ